MIKAFGWAAFPGLMIGAVLIPMIGVLALLVGILITVVVGGVAYGMAEGVGNTAAVVLNPAAGSRGVQNSRAEALLAQGRAQEAVIAWEVTALEHPSDPTAPTAIARICRDSLSDAERAPHWFKQALRAAGDGPAARVVIRELVEVSRRLPDRGASAAPELARFSHVFQGTTDAEWAENELIAIKRLIAEGRGDSRDP